MASASLDLARPPSTIFEILSRLLVAREWTIRQIDKKGLSIQARTVPSLMSWGEDVTIQVKGKDSGSVVIVDSNPSAQLIDWGKSRQNVEKLLSDLKKELGQ